MPPLVLFIISMVEIASFVVGAITINMGCEVTLAELKITAEMCPGQND